MTALALAVPVFGQREAECGNTSLKSVLWFLGARVSAARLADLAGATAEGIDHAGLVTAAVRCGLAVFERRGGSLAELRWFLAQGHPAIVGWWSMDVGDAAFTPAWTLAERKAKDCGHYSVVAGMDADRVLLVDPQWRWRAGRWRVTGRRWMAKRDFSRRWYDTDGPAYRKVERWYAVVHRGAARFAGRFGGVDHGEPVAHSL
jgi:ABC-type bacteriocin/lantibiotic exporter with double-glycine peptidase domain